jgi:Ca2+/Na+ antiporter
MLGPTIDEDNLIVSHPTGGQAFIHFLSMFWKIIFATCPPPKRGGGWPCFCVALTYIGVLTGIVGAVAELCGCVLGIPKPVTAITLVAIGTSLPDTFASMTAAKTSDCADSAVGNVTGSNSVNVFLGLGLPWVIGSMYNSPDPYKVPAGPLGFSVALFLACSVCCFIILLTRRKFVGGELGGPPVSRYISAFMCMSLWLIYIILSILQN